MANQHIHWRGKISEAIADFDAWLAGAGATVTIVSHSVSVFGPTSIIISVIYTT